MEYKQLERIEQQQIMIIETLRDLRVSFAIPRKPLSQSTKQAHCRTILARRNGFCPCCELATVVATNGEIVPGAEFDHWYRRDRNGTEETWLVCGSCNERLNNPSYKAVKHSLFVAYQQAVRIIDAVERLPLFQEAMAGE